MLNFKVLFIVLSITCLSCKNSTFPKTDGDLKAISSVKEKDEVVSSNLDKCSIPDKVFQYFKENSITWQLVTKEDLNLVHPIKEDSQNCFVSVLSDFNQNGKKDFAIIARSKDYRVDGYGNHNFPFVLIFNDFQTNSIQEPFIIERSHVEKTTIKTIVYDQFEQGIITYLDKESICDQDVLTVILPEKTSFIVYWDKKINSYAYINSLDLHCTLLNIQITTSISKRWFGKYEGTFIRLKEESGDPRSQASISFTINATSAQLTMDSYSESIKENLNLINESENTIVLKFKENQNSIVTLKKNADYFSLNSTLLDSIMGEKASYKLNRIKL